VILSKIRLLTSFLLTKRYRESDVMLSLKMDVVSAFFPLSSLSCRFFIRGSKAIDFYFLNKLIVLKEEFISVILFLCASSLWKSFYVLFPFSVTTLER